MNNSGTQTTFVKNGQLSKDKKSLILTDEYGNKMIVNANFAKFHLEVPYTKKDGITVSTEEIMKKKKESSEKLAEAIKSQKEKVA